jgi:hypothetical protein
VVPAGAVRPLPGRAARGALRRHCARPPAAPVLRRPCAPTRPSPQQRDARRGRGRCAKDPQQGDAGAGASIAPAPAAPAALATAQRKLFFRITLLFLVVVFFNFLDKGNLAFGALQVGWVAGGRGGLGSGRQAAA